MSQYWMTNPLNCGGWNRHCDKSPVSPEQPQWSLHCFERGEDLLRQLRRETFDLLILDWQLPDISGIAILRWTREHMEAPPRSSC